METKFVKYPACFVGKCHLVDIAPDFHLNQMVDAFVSVEMLETSPAYASQAIKLLEESGLIKENPSTILAMKAVLSDYRDRKKK